MKKNNLEDPVITLHKLYQLLVQCVDSGDCDQDLACDYFSDSVILLHRSFYKFYKIKWVEMFRQNLLERELAWAEGCRNRRTRSSVTERWTSLCRLSFETTTSRLVSLVSSVLAGFSTAIVGWGGRWPLWQHVVGAAAAIALYWLLTAAFLL